MLLHNIPLEKPIFSQDILYTMHGLFHGINLDHFQINLSNGYFWVREGRTVLRWTFLTTKDYWRTEGVRYESLGYPINLEAFNIEYVNITEREHRDA